MLVSLIWKQTLERSLGECLATLFSYKMPWVRRYYAGHTITKKKKKKITPGRIETLKFVLIMQPWGYIRVLVCAGWKICTAAFNIRRRVYNSIHQRVASYPCHVVLYSSACGIWCSYVHHYNQDGNPWTKCLCKSIKCS